MNGVFRRFIRRFHRSRKAWLCAPVLALAGLSSTGAAQAAVRYVDDSAGGSGSGLSWCNAYTKLQDALSAAAASAGAIDEIRVAQGLYKPDVGTGQTALARASTFRLINGVALKGGYAGCGAPNPDARNVDLYPSILTGDLSGNDLGDRFHESRAENAYHVVTGNGTNATAILDGFTITAGRANGTTIHGDGGGLYNDGGSPTIGQCTFTQNYAIHNGGAIRNWRSSSPTRSQIRKSLTIPVDYGGGINNTTLSNPVITTCEIARNTCGYHGAGVYNDFSSLPQLIGCSINDNRSFYNGGGVANYNQSHAILTECTLRRNESAASVGGGMFSSQSSPTVTDSLFEGNRAIFSGGGVSSMGGAPTFTASTFKANRANNGGGMINDGSSSFIHNCLFERNTVTIDGAAIYNLGTGTATIRNSTLVNNTAGRFGGGVFNSGHNPVLMNLIIWGNADNGGSGETAQIRGGTPAVTHCCVQGWSGLLGGGGNHGLNPRFTSGAMGCYYLSQFEAESSVHSPCVDSGNDAATLLGLETMTTRLDSIADVGVADMGYHYAVVNAYCGPGNFTCHGRINLRDVAKLQRCFGGQASAGVLCCEELDVDGQPGVTLGDLELLAPVVSNP